MNRDFVEMLSALSGAAADYLVVGAHAMAAHGHPRATGDLNIWVRADRQNASRVLEALREFGAPLFDLTLEDLSSPGTVFQIGQSPCRVDLLSSVSGVSFDEAWPRRCTIRVGTLDVPVIGLEDLVRNKRATGRPQDVVDADRLEADRGEG